MAALVTAGFYHEPLGLPAWFGDFAMLVVMPIGLIVVLLMRRYAQSASRGEILGRNSRSRLQRLWDYKPNRIWFAAVIMGVISAVALLVPPNSRMPLRENLAVSLVTFALGIAVVFIALRWRRH
jgi:hypothetical protein